MSPPLAIVACAAIARELVMVLEANGLGDQAQLFCLPADLHNRPQEITSAVDQKLRELDADFDQVLVGYGDCGTGGALDRLLESRGVPRLGGDHCYEFLQPPGDFRQQLAAEPGTFFLTDFLVRHFERLVIQGLGLDRFPELMPTYFGHYQRVLYLAQSDSPQLKEAALEHARYLGLEFEFRYVGLAPLGAAISERVMVWQN